MSFTYDFTTAPLLSRVRLLIADTDSTDPIFQDDEVNQAIFVTSSQGLFISGQANSIANGSQVPAIPQVYSIYRAAALLCDSIAANAAKASAISQLLDVKLDPSKAQQAYRDMAKGYRDLEDTSGQFAIAEMVNDPFSARERVLKQFQRLYGGY